MQLYILHLFIFQHSSFFFFLQTRDTDTHRETLMQSVNKLTELKETRRLKYLLSPSPRQERSAVERRANKTRRKNAGKWKK